MKISKNKAFSVMESLLFMSSEPRPLSDFEAMFEGKISAQKLKGLLEELKNSYKREDRGISLEQVNKGWQLRTKTENKSWLLKIKPPGVFRLSRPSLEALSIIAYEQPCSKMDLDEMRGAESGHLLRNLMEKGLIVPAGRSDLPGKAQLYKTGKKFLETFGLESLKGLPSQEEIEGLLKSAGQSREGDLRSVSQAFASSPPLIAQDKDERENKRIKDSLKSLPSTVDFLDKSHEPSTESPSPGEGQSSS